jgi:cysteine desulfurase
VMAAMGLPDDIASSFVRISFGPSTKKTDVDRFVAEWQRVRDRAVSRAA